MGVLQDGAGQSAHAGSQPPQCYRPQWRRSPRSGVRAYLRGDKENAVLDLGTATDEIAARLARSRSGEPGGPPS